MTVAVAFPFAESATEPGDTEQVEAGGAPPQLSATFCAKPEMDDTSSVKLTVWPATTEMFGDSDAIEKSGTMPVPFSSTTCGLPGTLSVIVSAPRLGPEVVAVYVTFTTQFVPGCRDALLQLSVSAKSLLATIPEIVSGDDPTFVTVTVCAAVFTPIDCVPKLRLEDESCTVDVLPVSATT